MGIPSPHAPSRLAFIDALRGMAALYVLIFHLVLIPRPILAVPDWIKPLVMNGGSGVTLFFVVSAFTLCHTLQARRGEDRVTLRFYLRRVFRIVPLYYAWLAFMATKPEAVYVGKKGWLMYLTFTYNFWPGKEEGLVWASWTLGVEMIFYLVFPLVFRVVTSAGRAAVFFALSLVAARVFALLYNSAFPSSQGTDHFVHFSFVNQLPCFAAGMVAFYLYERLSASGDLPRSLRWGLPISGLAGFLGVSYAGELLPVNSVHAMAVVYSALLIGIGINRFPLLVNPVTDFYGRISYSIYLNHPHVVAWMSPVFPSIYALGWGDGASLLACYVATLLPLTGLSYLTYKICEQPGIRLGGKIIRRLSAPTRISAEPTRTPALSTGTPDSR